MRKEKYVFNQLLLKYRKYKAKLQRFRLTGRNQHRQGVLEKHLERLETKLYSLLGSIKKAGAIAAVSTAIALTPSTANAQAIFAEGALYPFVLNPFNLTNVGSYAICNLKDLDGDGDLDLMRGSSSGNFFYSENVGTSTNPDFAAPQTNPFGLTDIGLRSSSDLVDLDGDGDLDLMSGHTFGDFYYFENTGTSTNPVFALVQMNPFGLTSIGLNSSASNSDLVDLDGDGDLDLMSGRNNGEFIYFENTGTSTSPSFTALQTNPFGLTNGGNDSNSNLVDIDGDGDLDLMSGKNGGGFDYYENTGTTSAPTFAARESNPFGLSSLGAVSNSDLVDLDGDGDLDLISGTYYGNIAFFENLSNVDTALDFSVPFPVSLNPFGLSSIGTDLSNSNLVDIDSDGDLDLMSGADNGNFLFFENTGSSTNPAFANRLTNPFGLYTSSAFSSSDLVDLDGDGDLDLMSGAYDGNFYYYENTGTSLVPLFTVPVTNPFNLINLGNFSSSDLVDLDGDGDFDLMSGTLDGNFVYFENIGSSTIPLFTAPLTNPYGLTDIGDISQANLVDLDGDGDLDLMCGIAPGDFIFFENTGSSTIPSFAPAQTNPFGLQNFSGIFPTDPTFGLIVNSDLVDLDGDGDLDLMSGDRAGIFIYFENITCEVNPIVSSTTATPESAANAADGVLAVVASGGSGQLSYSWAPGGETDSVITGLSSGSYFITVTDTNNCAKTDSVFLSISTAINTLKVSDLAIYPNPTTGLVSISFETNEAEDIHVRLVDIMGKTILAETTANVSGNFTKQVDLSNLAAGMYFLEISDGNGTLVEKIKLSK